LRVKRRKKMKTVSLNVESREASTKGVVRRLKRTGKIPATFYGKHEKSASLMVDGKTFDKLLHSGLGVNVLINMKVNGEDKTCILKEIQRDIMSNKPMHIDFLAISMKDKLEVNVPLKVVGVAPGVKNSGGILEYIMHDIHVKCLPSDIPQFIEVNVSSLELGHGIYVKDLSKIENVEFLADPEKMVLNVVLPKVEEAPAADATAVVGAAEPEVVGAKGKKDKEGEEGAAPAPGAKTAAAPADKKAEPKK
jgi:large subunit ribosomal protein L25